LTETPLFQTNFFPCLTHVCLRFLSTIVEPTFLQVEPALVAALVDGKVTRDRAITATTPTASRFIRIPLLCTRRDRSTLLSAN
jgi:hypothetical protein